MKTFYYAKTYLPGWEEMIVSHDSSNIPELLVWEDGLTSPHSNHTLYSIEYLRQYGEWVQVHANFNTYLPFHVIIRKHELVRDCIASDYPPGFHMK